MGRTMATITERRAAAELRKRMAGEAGERGGDAAFRQYRSQAPGVGARREVTMPSQLRAQSESRNGKPMIHTSGFFTRYERAYPMWDTFGEYEEVIARGAGRETLASNPDVAFLVNHKGVTMARTKNNTLILEERDEGGWHDGWLNPERQDVRDFASAITDGLVDEMSYAFMIPDNRSEWSEDFLTFRIGAYNIDRGDVSGVNYGANPFTDIAAQTPDVLNALERLPEGALREASSRLAARGQQRERIEVRTRVPAVDPTASRAVRALKGRHARTAERFVDLAERNQLTVAEVVNTQLPWYEIREHRAAGDSNDSNANSNSEVESTDVFIYDEIGGSFGVDAKTFAQDLEAITTPLINIRFNSPGGSVFDGEAIHSSILHHPARTVGYVDGLAASAASLILTACDEIVMMPAGEIMLHDAAMGTQGDARAHEKGATYLNRHSDHIADLYGARMGIDREEARQIMLDETWAFADEAIAMGMADRQGSRVDMVASGDPAEERMAKRHDLGNWAYRYQGRSAAPAPRQTRKAEPTIADAQRDLAEATRQERSTAPVATGRSIALIEAELDADMF